MSAVLEKLNPLYTSICNLLAELAGNEAYLATLESHFPTTMSTDNPNSIPQPANTRMFWGEFTFPGTYGFTMSHAYWGSDLTTPGPPPIETEKQLAQAAETAWHNAYKLYQADNGNAGYLRDWGRNIWEPDPAKMSSSVDNLVHLAQWLNDQLKPEAGWQAPGGTNAPPWLTNLKKHWPATSQTSETFYEFWDDVNDKCGHYRDATQRLASTSAQATATVADFQKNLLEVTEKAKNHVELTLQQWQRWRAPSGAWPTGKYNSNEGAKTILGYISYGSGVIALFPPASVISGGISVVTGGLSYIIVDQSEIMELTHAARAYEIWSGYAADVEKIEGNMRRVLDKIHTTPQGEGLPNGSMSIKAYTDMAQASRKDWAPLEVDLC